MEVEEDVCNICKKEAYLHPTMKLLKSICGHKCCEACINLAFATKMVLHCPVCNAQLRKANFFDENSVQNVLSKEISVRRKIEQEFNKREEDFKTLDEFNDYLEEREDIIYNLVNDIDVDETQAKVKENRKKNRHLIQSNQARQVAEQALLDEKVRVEQEQWLLRRTQFLRQDQKERLEKLKAEAAFLQGLSAGASVERLENQLSRRRAKAASLAAASVEEEMQEALAAAASSNMDVDKKPAFVRSYQPQKQNPTGPKPIVPMIQKMATQDDKPRDFKSEKALSAGGWDDSFVVNRIRAEASLLNLL